MKRIILALTSSWVILSCSFSQGTNEHSSEASSGTPSYPKLIQAEADWRAYKAHLDSLSDEGRGLYERLREKELQWVKE